MFFKKSSKPQLLFFKFSYGSELVIGVTSDSHTKAEELINEEVFHNLTIPGFPTVEELTLEKIREEFKSVPQNKVLKEGIWYR